MDIPSLLSGLVVSLRDSLDGGKCIRIAPHFYNTEQEIYRLLEKISVCPAARVST